MRICFPLSGRKGARNQEKMVGRFPEAETEEDKKHDSPPPPPPLVGGKWDKKKNSRNMAKHFVIEKGQRDVGQHERRVVENGMFEPLPAPSCEFCCRETENVFLFLFQIISLS